ncbi:MAG TPA: NAD(P)H-binding protein [Solirubrobacteraceae bacterium]|nr:NAD(P)H-binding protein [Solirubrobacteraceae bacterium]
MSDPILVIGATGTVGGATLRALRAGGFAPAAFVRDAERAGALLGGGVELRVGDLADPPSLRAALDDVDAVLLCSGHGPEMRQLQIDAVDVIAESGVERVVKISGSPASVRADSTAELGRDHLAIEEALRATACETVAIRPSIFMQTFLEQSVAVAHGALPGLEGEPRVSFVDARDIGRVAAATLTSGETPDPVLEVTGPEALTWFDVAGAMSAVLGRTVTHHPVPPEVARQALLGMGRSEWLVTHMLELAALSRDPKAAEVTDTVRRLSGRAPNSFGRFLAEHADAFPAAA